MKNLKKYLALAFALCMLFALAACGEKETPADDSGSDGEQNASDLIGTYQFAYVAENGDKTTFMITLDEGSFLIVPHGALSGSYSGTEWTDNGDGSFTTGACDLSVDFAAADGSVKWIVDGTTATPDGYVEPEIEPSQIFTYNETNDYGLSSVWTLELKPDGTYVVSESNEFVGDQSYTGDTYTIDGDTVVCGPLTGEKPGIANWTSNENGFTVTIDGDTFTPVDDGSSSSDLGDLPPISDEGGPSGDLPALDGEGPSGDLPALDGEGPSGDLPVIGG